MIFNPYSKYKSGYYYLKQQKTVNLDKELKAITDLCRKKFIIVCKPYRGNGVVLLNKSDYNKKMEDVLLDNSKFKPTTNNIFKQLKKFQSFLFRLKKSGSINQEIYDKIRSTSASLPALYGLPKIPEENSPLRPILSSIGSYNHECAICLS